MNPDVSIIMPVYNVEHYLEQCLNSVLAQTLSTIEVIVVNDGSTDSSPDIMARFASHDARIRVIDKENTGYGDSLNQGIACATGEYIGIVETDDWVDQRMYARLIQAADQFDRSVDVVKAAYYRVIDSDTPHEHNEPAFFLHDLHYVGVPFKLEDDATFLFHHPSIWSAIYRKAFLDDHNIRFRPIPGAGWADNPFMLEALMQAESIVYLDEPLYYYREFNEGSSSSFTDPTLYFERWNDMADIIERAGTVAPAILEGHYNRACFYLDEVARSHDLNTPELKPLVKRMLSRMDYDAIYASNRIAPEIKDRYQQMSGPLRRLSGKLERLIHRDSR